MRTTSPQDQDQPPAAATSGSDTPPAVTDWRPARKSDRQFTVTDAAAITSPQERDSVMQQEPQERERQSDSRPETAREAAIDFIRPYVLDGWTFQEISKKQPRTDRDEYTARIGGGKVTDHRGEPHAVTREQIAVTRIGYTPCWGLFDLLDIMNEIRDERRGYKQQSLAAIFAQQEREHIAQESAPRKRPAIFRSYNGGHCQNPACGAELGYIETDGGRDRQYCNDKCRVAAHRARQREAKRAQVLQYHGELLDYWQRNGIRGEVLLRLQEILLQHGKTAAKRATDAVLVALAAAEEAGSNEW